MLYLVGTPRGRLSKLEDQLRQLPWEKAREGVEVKLLAQPNEVYVLAKSVYRMNTDRCIRRRQLKGLWKRLKELAAMKLKRDKLLMKLGAARQQAPAAWRLVNIQLPKKNKKFAFVLRKDKLREIRRREGHYRIEAHILVAFLAYCVHASLGRALKGFGARTDREVGAGKDVSDANDRRASADHRRTRSDPDPLHSTGNRTEDFAGEIEVNFARTTTPENHRHATREQVVP